MTLNDPKPRFQGHAIVWRWVSPKWLKKYGHSYYRRQIGNHTKAFKWYHFQWPRVTLIYISRSRCNIYAYRCPQTHCACSWRAICLRQLSSCSITKDFSISFMNNPSQSLIGKTRLHSRWHIVNSDSATSLSCIHRSVQYNNKTVDFC